MQTTNKIQTGETVKGTSTSTTYTYNSPSYSAEKGWECPRCGRINAPWVRQCDCSPSTSWNKITVNPCDEWWRTKITCDDNMFRIHPDSITYCTNVNQVDPNVTAQNYTNPDNCHTPHYTTETVVSDNLEPLTRHFKD